VRPIKISKKDWGLIVMAVSLGLASIRPSDPYIFVPAIVAAWLGCLYLVYHHEGTIWRRWSAALLVTVALLIFAYRNLALSTHPVLPSIAGQESPLPPISIYIGCAIDGIIPIHIPRNSSVHVIELHPAFLQWARVIDTGVLQDIASTSDKPRDWPSKAEGRWMTPNEWKKSLSSPPLVFKCTISSNANSFIEDLSATLLVEVEAKHFYSYPVRFDPLPTGSSFTFYVVNACSSGIIPVDAQWDQWATFHVPGEKEMRRVPLQYIRRPSPSSLMPIFGASEFLWNNLSACVWSSK
jgi:uncharacterized integral membrane protein